MDHGTLGLVVTIVLVASALGTAMVAGVFFAFSTFVMSGLDRSGTAHAVPAMQGINVAAVRPPLRRLNQLRTVTATVSAGLLLIALVLA